MQDETVKLANPNRGRALVRTHRTHALMAWATAIFMALAAMFLAAAAVAAAPAQAPAPRAQIAAEASAPAPARLAIDGERPRVTEVSAWAPPSQAA